MDRRDAVRDTALQDLQASGVLMMDGHFDYRNGYHVWRFAQDLIDVLPPDLVQETQVVAGPVTLRGAAARRGRRLPDSEISRLKSQVSRRWRSVEIS